MGHYNKINDSQAGVVRKLFDYSIHINGREIEMVRIGVDGDIWGNEDIQALSCDIITANIIFPPGELPLLRFRESGTESAGNQSLFFYDVLPIEAYFQFKDRVEKGDYFYFTIDDENGKKIPIVLKVMEPVGTFSSQLLHRKFLCSAVTSLHELPEDVAGRVMEKIAA